MTSPDRPTQNAWGPIVQVALEQRFPPQRRVIHDPLAYTVLPVYLQLLVKVAGTSPLREMVLGVVDRKVPGVRGGVLCRKRAIDDWLTAVLTSGVDAVVNFGAGMDTRACRFPPAQIVPVYEVDLPETVAAKAAALRRAVGALPAHLHLVAVDLERPDVALALHAAGYAAGRRVFFIMEGVSQYISEAAVRRMLETTRSGGAGSRLGFTYVRRDFLEGRNMYDLAALYRQTRVRRSTWRFGLDPASIQGFLADYGWQEVEHLGPAEYQARYIQPTGRTIPVMAVERLVYAEKV